jgi:hypothetical protein
MLGTPPEGQTQVRSAMGTGASGEQTETGRTGQPQHEIITSEGDIDIG